MSSDLTPARPVLFTDLDNTLIFSHRHPMPEPHVWVETLHGAPQSRMTRKAWDWFAGQQWLEVIPVTTRTPAQFARLADAWTRLGWTRALLCNGAICLEREEGSAQWKENQAWREESLAVCGDCIPAFRQMLNRARELAGELAGEERVIATEPFQFYLRGHPSPDTARLLEEAARDLPVTILSDGRKLYGFPSPLTKGLAARRCAARLRPSCILAAGDSLFDVPMLREARTAFFPAELGEYLPQVPQPVPVPAGRRLSDALCEGLETISTIGNEEHKTC